MYQFAQSSKQTFFFIESAEIGSEALDNDDLIIAYNGDVVVGSRYWNGELTDIPAMGMDDYGYTNGYCKIGDKVSFKVWDASASELVQMETDDATAWQDLGISVISLSDVVLPETFSLDRAYPNPFNPSTNINFALPEYVNVLLEVYDINGRLVKELYSGIKEAGYYSVVWNADNHSSGMYFVKLQAGDFLKTQKLMLVK